VDIVRDIGAVVSILGIPAILVLVLFIQNTRIASLKDQIDKLNALHEQRVNILNERIKSLEMDNPVFIRNKLEALRKTYEEDKTSDEKRNRAELDKERSLASARIIELETAVQNLRKELGIMNQLVSGYDYRVEILDEQLKKKKE
jgi:hypothetical protein